MLNALTAFINLKALEKGLFLCGSIFSNYLSPMKNGIILFDGVCNMCNGLVNFVIDRDPKGYFKFASLQSENGQDLLKKYNLPLDDFDSFILIEDDKVFQKSTGGLKVARHLSGLWPVFYVFIIFPAFFRNFLYSLIAKNRYKMFGKRDACRIPEPGIKSRFLD